MTLNAPNIIMIRASAMMGGINLLVSPPMVEPKSTEGMMIMTMLKSTKDVFLLGCLLGSRVMKLKSAVPTVRG